MGKWEGGPQQGCRGGRFASLPLAKGAFQWCGSPVLGPVLSPVLHVPENCPIDIQWLHMAADSHCCHTPVWHCSAHLNRGRIVWLVAQRLRRWCGTSAIVLCNGATHQPHGCCLGARCWERM